MNIFFGLPILIGIIFGLVSPYYALELNQYTIYILALMSVLSLCRIDFETFKLVPKNRAPHLAALFVHYLIVSSLVWVAAHFLFENESLQLGFFWASLSPTALFVPTLITKNIQSKDYEIAIQFLILSMILMPPIAWLMSFLFFGQALSINLKTYAIDLFLVTTAPIAIVLLLTKVKLFKKVMMAINLKTIHVLNLLLVGLLSYIFLGTALLKLNFRTLSFAEQGTIVLFSLGFDFLIYFGVPFFLRRLVDKEYFQSLRTCISVRNVAIGGSMLLFYRPQSVLSIVGIFISHWIFISIYHFLAERKQNFL